MKLGSETGSLMNHIESRQTVGQPKPEVGMGVTFLEWTDRRPGTIVCVGDNWFGAREDKATRVDTNGMSEVQEWAFERDDSATTKIYALDKKGQWREQTYNEKGNFVFVDKSQRIVLGRREKYHDFSF